MDLKVNGRPQTIEASRVSVAEVLVRNDVAAPETVAVQRNGEFVEAGAYATTYLETGDELEFLYYLGGGAKR
jgi:sulfur carrier protein